MITFRCEFFSPIGLVRVYRAESLHEATYFAEKYIGYVIYSKNSLGHIEEIIILI